MYVMSLIVNVYVLFAGAKIGISFGLCAFFLGNLCGKSGFCYLDWWF